MRQNIKPTEIPFVFAIYCWPWGPTIKCSFSIQQDFTGENKSSFAKDCPLEIVSRLEKVGYVLSHSSILPIKTEEPDALLKVQLAH